MTAIKTINLTKKYKDVVAVDNLNLEVKKGELLSLLGVNGAGKTTTIKMLTCLSSPTSGDAYLLDKSILTESDKIKEFIAVSPQETAISKGLSVQDNLKLICGAYDSTKNTRTYFSFRINRNTNQEGRQTFGWLSKAIKYCYGANIRA